MTNDVFVSQRRGYIVLVQSRFPLFNQSSQAEYGKCSSPVGLALRLVRGCYNSSVRGLRLAVVVSHFDLK